MKTESSCNWLGKKIYNLLKNAFYGRAMENVKNWIRVEFIKKDDFERIIKSVKILYNSI